MKEFVETLIGRLEEEESREIEKIVKGNVDVAFTDGVSMGIALSRGIVEELAKEYNNGWIPCEKELPETNESVLCWAKSTARGGDVCFVGSYHKGFWFLQSSANTHSFPGQYKIVAWQQLPEPYQKGSE